MLKFLRDVYYLARGRNELGEPLDVDSVLNSDNERYGRFARGNVSIQNGAFLSVEEMERKRETLALNQFPARSNPSTTFGRWGQSTTTKKKVRPAISAIPLGKRPRGLVTEQGPRQEI